MVMKCEIKFDNNPNGIYFAGQTLSGNVELTIDKPKKIRGLILKVEGYAKVQWTESERRRHHNRSNGAHRSTTKTVHYSGREDYLNTVTYLIGSSEGNQIEIAPGAYQYNFQAILPPLLPTSFEAKHGSIRYLVNVVVDRPWKFDLTYKVAFTVLKQLDLNYENPALKIPTKMEVTKTFYCGLCKTGPLYFSASIPISGFVAGQNVKVSISINNQSGIDIQDVRVTLNKIISYNSQTPTKRTKEEVLTEVEVRSGGVVKNGLAKYDQRLEIPPVPPSNQSYCRILNVAYEIHVTAKTGGVHSSPVLKLPIVIGTVPLSVQLQQNEQFVVNYPTAPAMSPSPTNQQSIIDALAVHQFQRHQRNISNAELPPPSYHEAVGSAVQLNEEGEHSMGSRPFNPMYPVYHFENSQLSINETDQGSSSSRSPAPGSISESGIVQKY